MSDGAEAGCGLIGLAAVGGLAWAGFFYSSYGFLIGRSDTPAGTMYGYAQTMVDCNYLTATGTLTRTLGIFGAATANEKFCPRTIKLPGT